MVGYLLQPTNRQRHTSNVLVKYASWSSNQLLLTTLQLALIWPAVPVSGLMLPIFIMAVTKSAAKRAGLELYCVTSASCDPPLKSSWSECSRPRRTRRLP
jgi:hypothetical protein